MLSIGVLYYSSEKSKELPVRSEIDSRLYGGPIQTMTDKKLFNVVCDGKEWKVEPLRQYEMYGLLVSYNDSDGLVDYIHEEWGDTAFNFRDLGLIWGGNISSESYVNVKFYNTTTWIHWRVPSRYRGTFLGDGISNNHVLSADTEIKDLILSSDVGDQIYFKGYLCNYSDDNGFKRCSSLTRTDRGNGACETVYVTDFKIIKSANVVWRVIRDLLWWVLPVLVVLLLYFTVNTPIRLNF